MEIVEGIVAALPHLINLTEEKILNKEKYPVFNVEEASAEKFWDSLNKGKYYMLAKKRQYHSKIDVGGLALHQGFMTPNFRWDCSNTKFKDLSRRQQKIIVATFNCKDEPYLAISIRSLCGKLFRI